MFSDCAHESLPRHVDQQVSKRTHFQSSATLQTYTQCAFQHQICIDVAALPMSSLEEARYGLVENPCGAFHLVLICFLRSFPMPLSGADRYDRCCFLQS